MSKISSLEDVINGAVTNTVNNEEVIPAKVEIVEKPQVEKPIPRVGEEVIETEDGYRIVKKEDISASSDAKELHSSTPENSLDNLAKLGLEMDEKVEVAKKLADEARAKEELDKSLSENTKTNMFSDKIIEVTDDEIAEKVPDEKSEEEKAKEAAEAKELSEIKILKFSKNTQKKKQYDRIIEKRKRLHNEESQQCVLINSGYFGSYSGMLSTELLAIKNMQETADSFNITKYIYGKLHEHLVDTSIGKMSFEQWLKGTSLLELNSIFFSVFSSTYPDVNEYPGLCSDEECNKRHNSKAFTFTYPNKNIMFIEDDERKEVTDSIIGLLHTKEPIETFKNSEVNFLARKKLSNGTIIDFRHPSLYNHLNDTLENLSTLGLLNTAPGQVDEKEPIYNLMPYIENIFVPDDELGGFIQLEDFNEKLEELTYLNDDDLTTCGKVVDDIQEKYKIKFAFKNLTCPRCGKKLPDQPVLNVSDLLFLVQLMKAAKGNI